MHQGYIEIRLTGHRLNSFVQSHKLVFQWATMTAMDIFFVTILSFAGNFYYTVEPP